MGINKQSDNSQPIRKNSQQLQVRTSVTSGSAWVDLSPDDERQLLLALVGNTFGDQPQQHVKVIRASRSRFARKFVRMAAIKKTDTVMEIGSGCGFGTRLLAEKAARVLACDISPAYLAYAEKECAKLANIEFSRIHSRSLASFEDSSIDAVVSISVFIHLNLYDMYWYFREIVRVLKAGGRLCFDFADSDKLFRPDMLRPKNSHARATFFTEQAEHYLGDPKQLFQLMQWNSMHGIVNVAENCGLRYVRRRGDRLLLKKQSADR